MGDNLLLSCLAREIKRCDPSRFVIMETCWPEFFEQNPHVDAVFTIKAALWYAKPEYVITPDTREHLLDQMIKQLPLPVRDWERRVDLWYQEEAVNATLRDIPVGYLVVNPSGKQKHSANRKEWGWRNFCDLRKHFASSPVVQIGDAETPLLPDTIDQRGRPILESAHLIKRAAVGVFLEGGMMHLANAVNTPSVIIYGGLIRPEVSGYAMHRNLYAAPPCSPCFTSQAAMTDCASMECMQMISVQQVAAAIEELCDLRRKDARFNDRPVACSAIMPDEADASKNLQQPQSFLP